MVFSKVVALGVAVRPKKASASFDYSFGRMYRSYNKLRLFLNFSQSCYVSFGFYSLVPSLPKAYLRYKVDLKQQNKLLVSGKSGHIKDFGDSKSISARERK
jgi:hypothetical protein